MSHAPAITKLRAAFPKDEFPDRTVALYAAELEHLPDESVARAVDALIRSSRFLPRVSEILTLVAEQELNLPTTEEAWEIAVRGSLRSAHRAVRDAAEHVGGRWQILHSDNPTTVRAQFRTAYERLREQVINEYRTNQARALPDGLKPLGPTMAALPETTSIRPRPVMARLIARWGGAELAAPTEEEKADAIAVLGDESLAPDDREDGAHPLYLEAERIFAEAGV